jgi:hypothetical protein
LVHEHQKAVSRTKAQRGAKNKFQARNPKFETNSNDQTR